ncbi:glycoside hydrolase family 97 protein [Terrimonas sp. NA20]|uniref:Glycoside hydrolase family 97 protein n=1 Tax=Terrimonas ginsenosidimutans TaxID=2908004 RepID=A0ABS9KV75_9BACT|nr:glycoside hydrolase family 97 protein [Terrimonas ginsenosidimutans]MCG2616231.1 glycoside hydrolase family 97 protein [Terrimonas ginsenosidimutans]
MLTTSIPDIKSRHVLLPVNIKKWLIVHLPFLFAIVLVYSTSNCQAQQGTIQSPDKNITVTVQHTDGMPSYSVSYRHNTVIRSSRLGLITSLADYSKSLQLRSVSETKAVKESYELFTGKKSTVNFKANRKVFSYATADGKPLNIQFHVSDDGVAFQYIIPRTNADSISVSDELTTFTFDTAAKGFLQPMQVAKTGFESTNPAYEDNYRQNIPAGTAATAGWVYPALFQTGDTWVLITEAGMDGTYCATRLTNAKGDPSYKISFPDPRETMAPDGILPLSGQPFTSPWRVITIGSLGTIVESTNGTDLAAKFAGGNTKWIKPGKSSWSWIMSKDDFITYDEQKKYIDFAADMKWQYCLVDASWDTKIGYDKIKELAAYANSKNVGLLLWYNSAGNWNTVKMTPKDKMLTHESRVKEFTRLKEMGVKGVKIDFFGGDGRSVIQYYIDILKDAAQFEMLVNFHGATLPRGWSRTYPNLVTTEAVKGFEMITFSQGDADREANHCAMLPFTRNAFDPMDFTPMNLYRIPTQVKRKTTSAFELATSVLFLSGIQHFAESADGMSHVPADVKAFLQRLPVRWDEVKFIEGFPGKYAVIARKAGNKWYVAGFNGESTARTIRLDIKSFKAKKALLIKDGASQLEFDISTPGLTSTIDVVMQGAGGFVLELD